MLPRRPRSPRKRNPLFQTDLHGLPYRPVSRLPNHDLFLLATRGRHSATLPLPPRRLAAQAAGQHEFRRRRNAGAAFGRSGGDREGRAAVGGSVGNLRRGADRVGEFAGGACGRSCADCDYGSGRQSVGDGEEVGAEGEDCQGCEWCRSRGCGGGYQEGAWPGGRFGVGVHWRGE